MVAIGGDGAYRDAALSGLANVGRRLEISATDFDRVDGEGAFQRFHIGRVHELHPGGKAVAVKYRRLDQAQRRHGRAFAIARQGEQAGQVALDAQFGFFQGYRRFVAIARQQVEAELRIEDGLRHVFEREQAHGLLLQLMHAGCAMLAGRGEDLDHRTANGIVGVQAAQEECERDGGGVGDDVDRHIGGIFHQHGFHERSAQAGVGALFRGVGEVDHRGIGRIAQKFEGVSAGFGVAGEDDSAGVEQAFRVQQVHDAGLVADAGERAGLFIHGGHQAERKIRAGGGYDVADLAGQQGIAADEGNGRCIRQS